MQRIRFIGGVILASILLAGSTPAAIISLGTTNVGNGAAVIVPLTIDSGTNVLGDYSLTILFNTNLLQWTSVLGGNAEFSSVPATVVSSVPGQVTIVTEQTLSLTTPTGLVLVAQISFTAIGAGGNTASLTISNARADGADSYPIPITVTNNGAVTIIAAPVASFTGSPTSGLDPLPVTFTDSSTGSITNRFWSFGDGATSNTLATSVAHTYPSAGTNNVSLTVSGIGGTNTLIRSAYIIVTNSPPLLSITPASLAFGSLTIGQSSNLSFQIVNFGQLTLTGTATVATPFAITSGSTYSVAGGQTSTVTVTFSPTASGFVNNNVTFTSNGGVSGNAVTGTGLTPASLSVTPPTLAFGTIVTGATAQLNFTINNTGQSVLTGTVAVAGGPFSIVGAPSYTVAGLGSTSLTILFAPVTAGSFSNSVTFTSNGGNPVNAVVGTGAIVPVASFGANPTSGQAPLPVTFTDTSTGTITNRFWNFGDGTFSNTLATTVVKTYLSAGTNSVTLIVSGPVGAGTNLQTNLIIVTNKPPLLAVSPATANYGTVAVGQTNTLPFQVMNLGVATLTGTVSVATPFAINGSTSYSVAGGATGTVNVSFIPVAAGTFSNSVTFASNGGTTNTLAVGVGAFVPTASFTATPTNGLAPLAVTFTDNSTGTITNRVWNFGDGATLTTAATSVAHTYGVAGTNTVTLIVSGPVGASTNTQTALITVLVYPPGDVNGTFTVTTGDSLLLDQVTAGLRTTNSAVFLGGGYANGDVNGDGAVTTGDALLIDQHAAGLRAYLVTKILPPSRSNNVPTVVTIYGIGFPSNTVAGVTLGPPINLALSNVVVISAYQINALVPAGGGLGTGIVNVAATPSNGVSFFGKFINQ